MLKAKVTVVIPMYNSGKTAVLAIESVLMQTYKMPIEIVVVNDGSTDDSPLLVEKSILANKTNRNVKLVNKENGGVSSARNAGINIAQTEWIAFLDSDDVWLPEKLEKQLKMIDANRDIKFIGTNRNGELYPYFGKSNGLVFFLKTKELLLKCYPQTSTALLNKDFIKTIGLYDERMTHGEDLDLWLRIADKCNLYVLNEDLVTTGGGKRSFGVAGLSANLTKMHEGENQALYNAFIRNQISHFEYALFYSWFAIKYLRRVIITGLIK